jgi:hypothetical protein
LCPELIANVWIANSSHKRVMFKYATAFCIYLLLILMVPLVFPALDFAKVIKRKQTDFINVAKGGMYLYHDSCYIYLNYYQREGRLEPVAERVYKLKKGFQYPSFKLGGTDTVMIDGATDNREFRLLYLLVPANSTFEIEKIEPSMTGVLRHVPISFVTTLIMPWLFTMKKSFAGVLLAENLLLLLYVFCSLCFFRKKQFPLALVLFCVSFVVILFSLIGLITPVVGALVRYRIPGIPFLIIAIALMTDEKKLKQVWTRISRPDGYRVKNDD